jgi:hypothetical protein
MQRWGNPDKIQNPKLEIQTNRHINIRDPNGVVWNFLLFDHWDLFRISDLEFRVFRNTSSLVALSLPRWSVIYTPAKASVGGNMKLSLAAITIAAALLKALCFLFVSLMNLILPPYGGAFLALLTSVYPGYDPITGPISVFVGTVYALLTGAAAGAVFAWLYNILAGE